MQSVSAGTLAGAGCFRCEACGFAIALHELDPIPACAHCGGESFKRSSIFAGHTDAEPVLTQAVETPEWLPEAREALVEPGAYVAFDDGERVHVMPLQGGWNRLGRSLAAHVRIDDPTVSRRHALVHCEGGEARVLDDRSLNGVFLNGERVEWGELHDGDEISIGRFRLYYISLAAEEAGNRSSADRAIA